MDINTAAGLTLAGFATILFLWFQLRRGLRRRAAKRASVSAVAGGGAATDQPLAERRLAALEAGQRDLAARLDATVADGAPEERLQAMASSLVSLIKDKNATLETALAGLDQLRDRLRALEQIGDLSEARGDLDRLGGRLDDLESRLAGDVAETRARLGALEERGEGPLAAFGAQLARLHEQRDAMAETLLARVAPLEGKLAALEARDPQSALDALGARLERLQENLGDVSGRLAALDEDASAPFAEIADQLTRLYAQKDAGLAVALERMVPLEAKLSALEDDLRAVDPQASVERLSVDLDAVRAAQAAEASRLSDEIAALKAADAPLAGLAERVSDLAAGKDAGREELLARVAPLEGKLAALEARDPQSALDALGARLERLQENLGDVSGRLAALDEDASAPFAEIADQLTRLYAQKDAGLAVALERMVPLEAKLSALEDDLRAVDPQASVERLSVDLDAVRAAQAAEASRLSDEIAALKAADAPLAGLAERVSDLAAGKDAGREELLARVAPLEGKLAALEARDPQSALDALGARLERLQENLGDVSGRLAALDEDASAPFAEIADQLTRLYAQKDAGLAVALERMVPLEAKLSALEDGLRAVDPQASVERLSVDLDAVRAAQAAEASRLSDEIAALKAADAPLAGLAERVSDLAAGKDAGREELLARVAPLEGKLAALEARDPQSALDALGARLERLQENLGDVSGRLAALDEDASAPFAEIADQLTRLYAQKDAVAAGVYGRIEPLETRLAVLETRGDDGGKDAAVARAEAEAIADQLAALRAAAEQTALFADRIALLEASLPRLTMAQSLMVEALERRAEDGPETPARSLAPHEDSLRAEDAPSAAPIKEPVANPTPTSAEPKPDQVRSAEEMAGGIDDIWDIPRVISMHRS